MSERNKLKKRQEEKKNKEQKRKIEQRKKSKPAKKAKKPTVIDSNSESSSECSEKYSLVESESDISYEKIPKNVCPYCEVEVMDEEDIVGCDICPRWMHRMCTHDNVLMDLTDIADIEAYPFTCCHCG